MVHFSFSPRIQFFFGQILILLALLCLFRCKSYERAKKKLTIEEAPNILTIALKRYQVPSRLSLSSNIYILKVLYEVMNTVLAIEMATTCAIEEWNFCSFMYLVGIQFCWDTLNIALLCAVWQVWKDQQSHQISRNPQHASLYEPRYWWHIANLQPLCSGCPPWCHECCLLWPLCMLC